MSCLNAYSNQLICWSLAFKKRMLQTVAHCTRIATRLQATVPCSWSNDCHRISAVGQRTFFDDLKAEGRQPLKPLCWWKASWKTILCLSWEISLNPVYSGLSLQHIVGPPCSSAEISPANQAIHSRAQQTHLSMWVMMLENLPRLHGRETAGSLWQRQWHPHENKWHHVVTIIVDAGKVWTLKVFHTASSCV